MAAFQFTHPGRGATCASFFILRIALVFQFTHPGRGATIVVSRSFVSRSSFNSRTPGGVRQCGAKLRIMGRINKRNLRLEVLL